MLDSQAVGDAQYAIPTGRAYRNAAGSFYADKIHIFPFGEKLRFEGDLEPNGETNEPRLYMGTAGLLNFGHIRAMRPSHVIFFDVNPFQTIFWNVVIDGVRSNEKYKDFCAMLNYAEVMTAKVVERRLKGHEYSARGSWTQILSHDDGVSLSRKSFARCAASFSSFLDQIKFSEDDYAFLRTLAAEGAIGTLTLDLFDEQGWAQLGTALRDMNARDNFMPAYADALYISSVLRFVDTQSDWTGRKMTGMTLGGLSQVLHPEKSIVMDYRGNYTPHQFHSLMKEKKPWLYHRQEAKASAPEPGEGRSAPHFG